MNKRSKTIAALWVAVLIWTALLFFFSGQSGEDSAGLSLMLTRLVLRVMPWLPVSMDGLHLFLRKLAHFSIFGVEGALLCAALWKSNVRLRRAAAAALPLCAVIAGLNEYHQSFTAGRHASIPDAAIDFAGALCGVALLCLAAGLRERRNAKLS